MDCTRGNILTSVVTSAISQFAAACVPGEGGISRWVIPTWYKYLDGETIAGKCTPVVNLTENPFQIGLILLAIVEILLRVAALVAVAFVIVGGFQFITSQGDPQSTNNARSTVINAVIGLVIAIFASVIVSFIAGNLT